MARYILVSVTSGILFGLLDGLLNANPLAQTLYAVYQPIARTTIDPFTGIGIDLIYGFALAGVFLLLYQCLPGKTGLVKGTSYALLVWFFRVVMSAASQWVMFDIPVATALYSLTAGLGELLILGVLYGVTLRPRAAAS